MKDYLKRHLLGWKMCKTALLVSATTAKNIVDDLVSVDVLDELTGNKRNRHFAFKPYLQLLKKPFPKYE